MPEISLRPAEGADGEAIARIQWVAWRATYGHLNPAMIDDFDLRRAADNWARAAGDPEHRLRVAMCDGVPVGYAFSGPGTAGFGAPMLMAGLGGDLWLSRPWTGPAFVSMAITAVVGAWRAPYLLSGPAERATAGPV